MNQLKLQSKTAPQKSKNTKTRWIPWPNSNLVFHVSVSGTWARRVQRYHSAWHLSIFHIESEPDAYSMLAGPPAYRNGVLQYQLLVWTTFTEKQVESQTLQQSIRFGLDSENRQVNRSVGKKRYWNSPPQVAKSSSAANGDIWKEAVLFRFFFFLIVSFVGSFFVTKKKFFPAQTFHVDNRYSSILAQLMRVVGMVLPWPFTYFEKKRETTTMILF